MGVGAELIARLDVLEPKVDRILELLEELAARPIAPSGPGARGGRRGIMAMEPTPEGERLAARVALLERRPELAELAGGSGLELRRVLDQALDEENAVRAPGS